MRFSLVDGLSLAESVARAAAEPSTAFPAQLHYLGYGRRSGKDLLYFSQHDDVRKV
ncbi:hypothetical protein [Corynebacterium pyruviciproducens]|uniref:Uncharacterized protein n=1 Tax=Corynebacterium pyruviciproducens TaxID=598660 RepID=A0AAF1BRB1_9CORY|nr:hypothetical protein [Corynebacterium pyruviciproducens]MDH4657174.1 hypothetical protein [Corynebacterium pyruviciproducens]MDK6566366.1 hypothetical protein [Corynebacterium pyruviciproducens]MDK7213274.1 hypothetical protein [Corynebacterium pyruviciproducens]WOT01593.1 hypothetical protein CYJ47_10005 [Corynebacterium pyruviciproducens]